MLVGAGFLVLVSGFGADRAGLRWLSSVLGSRWRGVAFRDGVAGSRGALASVLAGSRWSRWFALVRPVCAGGLALGGVYE